MFLLVCHSVQGGGGVCLWDSLRQTPWEREFPRTETPPQYGKEWAVRILLERILVIRIGSDPASETDQSESLKLCLCDSGNEFTNGK